MKNHAENVLQKIVPDSYLILRYKLKQWLQARNSFESKVF